VKQIKNDKSLKCSFMAQKTIKVKNKTNWKD